MKKLTRLCVPWLLVAAAVSAIPFAGAADRAPGDVRFITGPRSGKPLDIALDYLHAQTQELALTGDDLGELAVSDEYRTAASGVTHIYLQQRYQGIDVWNGVLSINVARDGSIINLGDRAVRGTARAASGSNARLAAGDAVVAAAAHLKLNLTEALVVGKTSAHPDRAVIVRGGGISASDIPVHLVWQPLEKGGLRLAWNVSIELKDGSHWWNVRVDAESGAVLDQNDWVVHDDWDPAAKVGRAFESSAGLDSHDEPRTPHYVTPNPVADGSAYQVLELPTESPSHDGRTVVHQPADATASPFGWHDTNGVAGPELTTTRGNNVLAATDTDANNLPDAGSSPDGGVGLDFAFPLDLTEAPDTYRPAAVTNLFYWNNLMHDVSYLHGFDEAAGNFQVNNYGRGGLGNDAVQADAQDGSGFSNANFSAPADGSAPRMQMYVWTLTTPRRDSDLDDGLIAHEYGHGISSRLTGGPANPNCLTALESAGMAEGWSDWMTLIFTMKPGDTPTMRRGVGTYLMGQPTNGTGLRAFPYSTDLAVDPRTYNSTHVSSAVHAVGSIWTAMLWEVNWALIAKHGFNPDLYGPWNTGGNNLAHRLVLDGLKLQPCNPGFVNGRDAILSGDLALTGGANQCEIWRAFAKRGLGFSASQGNVTGNLDNTEAFDLPTSCQFLEVTPPSTTFCVGTSTPAAYVVNLGTSWTSAPVALTASGNPAGTTVLFDPNNVSAVPGSSTLTIGNLSSIPAGSYPITIHGDDGVDARDVTASLVLTTALPGPGLTAPADGAADLNFTPELRWNTIAGATGYIVDVDDDTDFSTPVFTTTTSAATSRLTPPGLTGGMTYHWRVRATSSCGEGASSVRTFHTVACGPAAPFPLAPVDGSVDTTLRVGLAWSPVAGATGYVVEVDDDSDFGSVTFTTATSSTAATTSLLSGSTTYSWRVRSTTACGEGPSSTARTFRTVACGPAAPFAIAPVDGSTGVSPTVKLSWSTVPGADGYVVELDDDADFGSLTFTTSTSSTTVDIPLLAGSTAHSWRVRSTTACGQGPDSAAFTFTTGPSFCASASLAIPDNNTTVTSQIVVGVGGSLADLDLYIDATHTFVGDLRLTLTHVDTTTGVSVINNPGPGCSRDDITVTLDDEGTDGPVQLQCSTTPPALFGRASPRNPLTTFDGEGLAGTWRLSVRDAGFGDTGTLDTWCLFPTPAVCGNGITEGAEACDGGECCAPDCFFESAGAACATDGSDCTDDVCNGSGSCAHPDNAASCDDGDPCTEDDRCSAGVCVGGSAPLCDDDNPCTDDSCDSHVAGGCVHASNTSPCEDGSVCTSGDTCAGGTCVGGSNVCACFTDGDCDDDNPCSDDTCLSPGTPGASCAYTNNTAGCDDGNACTQTDSCQGGECVAANLVVCVASDPCHVAGTCDPGTGLCSNPPKANGVACDDGNACTQSDTCQAGACSGANPVVCAAFDQCHVAGACNPGTGLCSNPPKANGVACDDGNACTQSDTCQAGACSGANPVVCTASDQCHVAGACNPGTGLCSNPSKANGVACNDGNSCTQTDTCQAGMCSGANPVVCAASDQCHVAGACNPGTGLCSNPAKANGATCNDGHACTLSDVCTGGSCAGSGENSAPVVAITQPVTDQTGLAPLSIPITVRFTATDASGVVRETLKLENCTLFDGATIGDRDGLLSDEALQITKYTLCQAMSRCGYLTLDFPKIRVEAIDGCGNTGQAQRIIRRRLSRTEACAP